MCKGISLTVLSRGMNIIVCVSAADIRQCKASYLCIAKFGLPVEYATEVQEVRQVSVVVLRQGMAARSCPHVRLRRDSRISKRGFVYFY